MRPVLAVLVLLSCGPRPDSSASTPPTEHVAPRTIGPVDTDCEPDSGEPVAGTNRVAFEKDGLWGFVDDAGNVVIAPQYFVAMPFSAEGVAGVIAPEGVFFIDRQGRRLATAMMFDNGPDYFVQGFARIIEGGKTGFLDRHGKVVIPPRFDAAGSFCEGLAPVCMGCREVPRGEHTEMVGGQWGFVDREGGTAIPIVYDTASGFSGGEAVVSKGGRSFRIDRTGREIAGPP